MKCPYCGAELDCTDINQDKKDIYECVGENRLFVAPTGSTQEQIDALVEGARATPTTGDELFDAIWKAIGPEGRKKG